MLPLLLLSAALGAKKDKDDDSLRPRMLTDISARTVPQGKFRFGLFEQQFGLLDNAHVGTSLVLYPLSIPNVSAKVTAVEVESFSGSLQSGFYYYDLEKHADIPNGKVTLIPVGFTATWAAQKKLSFHGGLTWQLFRVEGQFTPEQIGGGLEDLIGADITDQLEDALGEEGGVALGANLALTQLRLGLDYRTSKRDAWILYAQASLVLNALIAGGVKQASEDGEEKTVGASASFRDPLDEVPAALVVAKQWSWKHYSLRVGVPLTAPFNPQATVLALPYAVNMYWQF